MAGVGKVAERVPGWVERLLIPALESRVRSIVKEEVGHLDRANEARFDAAGARFDAVEAKLDAKLEGIAARIESLEKRIPSPT